MGYTLVWFKRDLRVHDHVPLTHAAAQGPLKCLYIIELSLWAQPDAARQHFEFLLECLQDLSAQLLQLGLPLQVVCGEAVDVLARLAQHAPFPTLMSHQETGNSHGFARDRAVARWCLAQGLPWREWPQQGVVRRLPSRDLWLSQWQSFMGAPVWACPEYRLSHPPGGMATPAAWPTAAGLGLQTPPVPQRLRGGRARALQVLRSFLDERCAAYRSGLSSPLSAPQSCSRLSPYLTWGCLSVREVVQATQARLQALAEQPDAPALRQRQGLQAFLSRLHWQGHFIQKLESEPNLEFRCLHPGYEDLRDLDAAPQRLQALIEGRTGWPLVDACVAMLRETGWINFRMRAMLMSFASYDLWLPWQESGRALARKFIDYEPGIHWPQCQMQAGETGINTIRIYSPVKQGYDQDPQGNFIRRWVPELASVPDAYLHEPWKLDGEARAQLCPEYPDRIVDHAATAKAAKDAIYALRRKPEARAEAKAVVRKHGSRKRTADRKRAGAKADQLKLAF